MNTKKALFLTIAVFCFIISTNAQLFVGGNLGFGMSASKSETDGVSNDGPAYSFVEFMPMAGFFLSDKFAVGAGIGISTSKQNDREDPETIDTEFEFHINPFARYYLVQIEKFSLFGEGGFDLALGSSKRKSDGTTVDGPKTTDFTFYVAPAIAYDLSEHFTIEGGLGGLYFSLESAKQEVGNVDNKQKSTNFGFDLGLDNIFFGAIYRF